MKSALQIFSAIIISLLLSGPAFATGPDIRLMHVDGSMQSMADYIGRGKWVVVNVWSPSCSFCVQELPHITRFEKQRRDDVTVLGITLDYPSFEYGKIDLITAFLQRHPLEYPIFLADLESASEVIGNRLVGIPLTAIYHPDGTVLARWPGNINPDEIEEFMQNYTDYISDKDMPVNF